MALLLDWPVERVWSMGQRSEEEREINKEKGKIVWKRSKANRLRSLFF